MDPSALRATREMRCAQEFKSAVTARSGPGTDLTPTLRVIHEGRTLAWVDAPSGDLRTSFDALATILAMSSADEVTYIADIYGTVGDDDSTRDADLRFAAGDPAVREGILVVAGRRSGGCTSILVTYRYDGRRVRWTERLPEDVVSPVVQGAFEAGWDLQRDRVTRGLPVLPFPDLAQAVGCRIAVLPLLLGRQPEGHHWFRRRPRGHCAGGLRQHSRGEP